MDPTEAGFGSFHGGSTTAADVVQELERTGKCGFHLPFGQISADNFMASIRYHFKPRTVHQCTVCLGEDGLIHATGQRARHVCRKMGLSTFMHMKVGQ